jgi:SAM-dependent methyltransferase
MNSKPITNHLKHQSFQPNLFSLFLNPFFFIRYAYYRCIKKIIPQLKGNLLDFGCGRKPFENLFTVDKYVGVDIENTGHDHTHSKVDIYYDGKHLPFQDNSFDSLFCAEVLEHIFTPDETLTELNRVLKPGAKALFTVPFSWNEHETPHDYSRYSSFGIKYLLEKHGFGVIEHVKTGNFAKVNFQYWALYFFELFKNWGKAGYIISMIFIIPINIIGSILLLIMPKNKTLYFTNIILAEKNRP